VTVAYDCEFQQAMDKKIMPVPYSACVQAEGGHFEHPP